MSKTATLNIVTLPLNEVKPNPHNPRLHPPEQIRKLQNSLETFGYAKGSMVINTDNSLLAGHGMYAAMREEGYIEADFIQVDLPEGQAEAWMIADNKLGELSMWDDAELSAMLAEIQELPDIELEDTGFELPELEALSDNTVHEDDFDVDGALAEEPITQTGDLWLLGEHRVLCGDCTKQEDVERVMDGEKADMVFMDPPFDFEDNIAIVCLISWVVQDTNVFVMHADRALIEYLRHSELEFVQFFVCDCQMLHTARRH